MRRVRGTIGLWLAVVGAGTCGGAATTQPVPMNLPPSCSCHLGDGRLSMLTAMLASESAKALGRPVVPEV